MIQTQKLFKCLNNQNNCLKMLNIIQKGYLEILRLFYANKKKIHLREIAKQAQLNENSAFRFLNKLEQDRILKSEKVGNMKLFSLRINKKTNSILTFFDIERYNSLPSIRRTAIETYLNALNTQPIFVILFGSTAKNNFKKESDIDILLITNKKTNTKNAENHANAQSGLEVSTFQMESWEFIQELKLKEDSVVQAAIETGYPLVNHIKYYEEILNE